MEVEERPEFLLKTVVIVTVGVVGEVRRSGVSLFNAGDAA
jgi:hypothetical protein